MVLLPTTMSACTRPTYRPYSTPSQPPPTATHVYPLFHRPPPPPLPPPVPSRSVKERYIEQDGQRFLVEESHRVRVARRTYFFYADDHPTQPAQREWEVVDGQRYLIREVWYENGRFHRVGGPAFRRWALERLPGGEVLRVLVNESWYECGMLHRVDGPARSMWRCIGRDMTADMLPLPAFYYLAWEEWARKGEPFRADGPPVQHWTFIDGEVVLQENDDSGAEDPDDDSGAEDPDDDSGDVTDAVMRSDDEGVIAT